MDNILSLSASKAQTPDAGDGKYHISSLPQKSYFKGIRFSNLKILTYVPPNYIVAPNDKTWNGYDLNDPLTGSNGICRVPKANTSGYNDPIEVITTSPYSSSTATSAGIRVDLTVK